MELVERGILGSLVSVSLSDGVHLLILRSHLKFDVVPIFKEGQQGSGSVIPVTEFDLPLSDDEEWFICWVSDAGCLHAFGYSRNSGCSR